MFCEFIRDSRRRFRYIVAQTRDWTDSKLEVKVQGHCDLMIAKRCPRQQATPGSSETKTGAAWFPKVSFLRGSKTSRMPDINISKVMWTEPKTGRNMWIQMISHGSYCLHLTAVSKQKNTSTYMSSPTGNYKQGERDVWKTRPLLPLHTFLQQQHIFLGTMHFDMPRACFGRMPFTVSRLPFHWRLWLPQFEICSVFTVLNAGPPDSAVSGSAAL